MATARPGAPSQPYLPTSSATTARFSLTVSQASTEFFRFPLRFPFRYRPLKKKKIPFVSHLTGRLRPQAARWEAGVRAGAG